MIYAQFGFAAFCFITALFMLRDAVRYDDGGSAICALVVMGAGVVVVLA